MLHADKATESSGEPVPPWGAPGHLWGDLRHAGRSRTRVRGEHPPLDQCGANGYGGPASRACVLVRQRHWKMMCVVRFSRESGSYQLGCLRIRYDVMSRCQRCTSPQKARISASEPAITIVHRFLLLSNCGSAARQFPCGVGCQRMNGQRRACCRIR